MDNVFHATAADVEFAHEVTLSPALRVQAAYLDYYFFRDGHLVCTGFGGMSCVMVTVRWFKVVHEYSSSDGVTQ